MLESLRQAGTSLRHAAGEIRANAGNTFWWRNRVVNRVIGPIQRALHREEGIDVMAEDWDNLVVLDSCRADYFEENVDLDRFDEYRRVTSRASATPEWVDEHFVGRTFGDTVYVNANPHVSEAAPGAFHQLIDVWEDEHDDDLGTILADDVTEYALEAAREYDDKRLIVHYNQPHGPYVGDVQLRYDESEADSQNEALERHLVTPEDFEAAYVSNLEYLLPHLWELLQGLEGRTVVTADHGELLGKRLFPIPVRTFAHPYGLRDPDLLTVPWAVLEGERRRITDEGVNLKEVETAAAKETLRDLGYRS